MNIIGNNCIGGRWFQYNNEQFSNPFIWMVLPYKSIVDLLTKFYTINWSNISLRISNIRPNTFILTIDQLIDIHYVHYMYNKSANTIKINRNNSTNEVEWTGQVEYNKIWEYITTKYFERVKRMISQRESPCFVIRDETYANNGKVSLHDIAYTDSPHKRCIITTNKSIDRNDDLVKTIHCDYVLSPLPLIEHYNDDINSFFGYRK